MDYTPSNSNEDNLDRINYDGHVWEIGHFGEDNNGFSAYGFRQDGTIIRVTSKYEAELISLLLVVNSELNDMARQALAKVKGG